MSSLHFQILFRTICWDFGADGRIQQRSAVRAARQSKRVAGSAVQVGRSRVDG